MATSPTDAIRRWRDDPRVFVRDVFGVVPDAWQDDVLAMFPRTPRLAMKACKGPGKTTVLAWLCWKGWRQPAWRQAISVGAATGALLWGGATWGLSPDASRAVLPEVAVHSEPGGVVQPLPTLGQGQLRVINLWASWCGPCRQEMPIFAKLQASEPDVQFLFVNQGESASVVQAYLRSTQLALQGLWLDPSSALGPALGVAGLPATLFVNAEGQIIELHFGVLSEPALRARLRALREAR